MSSFMANVGLRSAMQTLPQVQPKEASGWDNFLSGAGRVGGSFLMGLAGGLQNYNPNNPYSSFGAAITAATPGLQVALARPAAEARAEFGREQERLSTLSKEATAEEIAQGQASRASVMSEGLGNVKMTDIAAGISQPVKQKEPYDFNVGMFPSIMQQEAPPSASGRVRNLMLGIQR
jgi:hypothetical protein